MIRVLQVFGRMDCGGAETMIMNIYRNIDRTKVQFDFVVHTQDKCYYDDEIRSLGGQIFSVPRFNLKNVFFYKSAWKKLLIEHPEWKIVHGHIMSVASIFLKIAKRNGLVTISHSHVAGREYRGSTPIRMFLEKRINADYYMACTQAAGQWFFGNKVSDNPHYYVLPNAIKVDNFVYDPKLRSIIRKELSISDDDVLIGHIGRFSNQKNHIFLLDVFKELATKNDKAKLLLVGGGQLEETIKSYTKELHIIEKVIFSGVRSDVNRLLQAMDCFVFPSLYEGLGIVLIEAQASGLPITMSDKVPEEAVLTKDLVTIMSLNQSADEWADHILSRLGKERYSHVEEIKAAGYDISDTSKWLEDFYLSKADEMRQ